MSLFMSHSGIGLDIGQDAVRIARLKPKGGQRILSLESTKLPEGLVTDSFGELNISDVGELSSIISNLMKSHGIRRKGVGVALPDFVYRVVVIDFDTMPKKDDETAAVINLRLRKLIPFDIGQAAVRYQYLGNFREGETHAHRFLVTLIRKTVLAQYEDCLKHVGLRPNQIGVSSLLVWNLYHDSIISDAGQKRNYALLNFSGKRMSVLVLDRGIVRFFRLKDLGLMGFDDADGSSLHLAVLRELGASLTYYKENFSSSPVELVYAGCPENILHGLRSELGTDSPFEVRPLLLGSVLSGTDSLKVGRADLYKFNAACSAAMEK